MRKTPTLITIFLRFLSQTIRHGMTAGALYGFVVMSFLLFFAANSGDPITLLLIGAVMVGLYTFPATIFLGTLGGIIFSLLTVGRQNPNQRQVMLVMVSLTPFIMMLYLYMMNADYRGDPESWVFVFGVMPILISMATMAYVARETTNWYRTLLPLEMHLERFDHVINDRA